MGRGLSCPEQAEARGRERKKKKKNFWRVRVSCNQPHWTDPSWPPWEKWMGQRPVSDKESQETSQTMSDHLTGDPPAGRRERQSSRTVSDSMSCLDRSQLFILGSWCGWRCLVSTHPCPCLLLTLQHSLLLKFLLLNKATLFEKREPNFISARSLT